MNCSLARALEQLGDPWTLLILRECLLGTRRFEDFATALGVSRKTLSDRLARMTACGLLKRVALSQAGKVTAYRLTDKARAAVPALIALMQWGDAWISAPELAPMVVTTRGGAAIEPVALRTRSGRSVDSTQLRFAAGPGANRRTQAHLEAYAGWHQFQG